MYACTGASPAAFAPAFAGTPFWSTAAFTSALNARASTFSPSWMSIALRVLPSRLELKRRDGSGRLAPRANVSFTTFVYVSPVQTIPLCDQTGTPAIAFDGRGLGLGGRLVWLACARRALGLRFRLAFAWHANGTRRRLHDSGST